MRIETGKGTINLMAVIAIWALSLSVNLPGLAVSPMLDKLAQIFPTATQLEVQLVSILPNLVIIPFVLLSGHLSRSHHKIALICSGLVLYAAAGLLYFLCKSMLGIILVSCLLGVGCGIFLPFATGLVADVFTGKYRMRQMGIVSAVGNLAVVIATYAVGWLAAVNWHLPFLVYLIPLVSLVLMPFLRGVNLTGDNMPQGCDDCPDAAGFSTDGQKVKWGFYVGRTVWLALMYFFWIYIAMMVTYYMPFLMAQYKMSSESVGLVTALFFLSMFVFGVILPHALKVMRSWTFVYAALLFAGGCLLFILGESVVTFCLAGILMGVALGISQPIVYDKATEICVKQSSSTMALAIILSMNYLAITVCPFITDFFRDLFRVSRTGEFYNVFPFVLDLGAILVVTAIILIRRKGFIFGVTKAYY